MRSEDWIQGPILRVFTSDSFEMQLTRVGQHNDFPYNACERIRIHSTSPPFITLTAETTKAQLEERLLGQSVRCYVLARDPQEVLLCEVTLVQESMPP